MKNTQVSESQGGQDGRGQQTVSAGHSLLLRMSGCCAGCAFCSYFQLDVCVTKILFVLYIC